jgi:hypothetical protein
MRKSLALVAVIFPLLGAVGTEAAIAAEWCGKGYFRDSAGHCRYWGYESSSAPDHQGCPPDRVFVPYDHHPGGRCLLK